MTRKRGTGKTPSGRTGKVASAQPAPLSGFHRESGDRVRPRVFEDVVRQIRVEIVSGRLQPGQRLPTETEMAAELGVSRGSVREAIRVLEMLGLVTVKRGRLGGAFTMPNCRDVAQASFASLLPLQQTSAKDSFEFRRIVEPQAAALAAVRATLRDREMLRAALQRTEDQSVSRETFGQHARMFHQAIIAAARNPCIETYFTPFLLSRELSFSTAHKEPVQRALTHFFHAKIFDAIDAGDADGARAWMDAHISQMEGDLVEAEGMQQLQWGGGSPITGPVNPRDRQRSETESGE